MERQQTGIKAYPKKLHPDSKNILSHEMELDERTRKAEESFSSCALGESEAKLAY